MSDIKLLPSQKNQIFELVQQHGFQPSEFEWQDFSRPIGGTRPRLFHLPSGFWIYFERYDKEGFYVTYSPAEETYEMTRNSGSWPSTLHFTNGWLNFLKRETEMPDLWEHLSKDTQLIQDAGQQSSDNLPFTEAELPRVHEAIDDIKSYILKTHELSETQTKRIEARFDYLEKKAASFGRKDWLNLVLGVLLTIGVDELRNGDSTKDLFRFAGEVFRQCLGTVLYLSGPH